MAHRCQKAAASLHRLLGIGASFAQLVFLLLEGRNILNDPIEDQCLLLLSDKVATHLQITISIRPLYLDLQIEGRQSLGMIGHLADKILERLFSKAEHLTTRFGIEQLLPGSPEDLAGPLRSIQKPPLAGSLPQILIDHPRHAVGNLGKAIFSLTGALLRLFDPADIGQYCQHPQHIAIGIAIRTFGIDNMAGRAIG